MEIIVPKPPCTRQEIFKAIQLLRELSSEHYGEPVFDQMAMPLNALSCALRKEAQGTLHTTKITDFFGEPSYQDLLRLLTILSTL